MRLGTTGQLLFCSCATELKAVFDARRFSFSVSESNCEGIEAQEFSAEATDSAPAGGLVNSWTDRRHPRMGPAILRVLCQMCRMRRNHCPER